MPSAASKLRPVDAAAQASHAAEAFASASAELALAVRSAQALQDALSPVLRRAGEGAAAFQALDDLTQHLQGLRQFLEAVACECPPAWRLDVHAAADGLRLHAQKLRLQGRPPSETPPTTGDLELW